MACINIDTEAKSVAIYRSEVLQKANSYWKLIATDSLQIEEEVHYGFVDNKKKKV